jgi:hypothetical protein
MMVWKKAAPLNGAAFDLNDFKKAVSLLSAADSCGAFPSYAPFQRGKTYKIPPVSAMS